MVKGGHRQTNYLHDLNWGAFAHTAYAPRSRLIVIQITHFVVQVEPVDC